ncbi:MAG: NAD(+) diphosphatase [Pseudohongiellaceae bacterium]|nr:NAD(+) diphosphatase [Pseudohongiellaceae bacterium]
MASDYFIYTQEIPSDVGVFLFHDGRFLSSAERLYWDFDIVVEIEANETALLYLGDFDGRPCVGLVLDAEQAAAIECESISARRLLLEFELSGAEFAIQANQLMHWLEHHRYCGRCATRTSHHPSERALVCETCQSHYYPRINPCVIMLVTKGDKMLLAQNARNKFPFFSPLAGFMEVGETPEETVAREVMEEVGIKVKNIRYFKSQSWPFPSQLMLGFYAEYDSGEICVDGVEIAQARWFGKDNMPERPSLKRPIKSVGSELVSHFLSTI